VNEEAKTHWGLSRQEKKKLITSLFAVTENYHNWKHDMGLANFEGFLVAWIKFVANLIQIVNSYLFMVFLTMLQLP
jgi:hypothetical protein